MITRVDSDLAMGRGSERGRAPWVLIVAVAALVAGVAVAMSQWRAQHAGPAAPPAGVEVPAPDTGETVIGEALAQIPVDSTALKNRWLDEVPGVDVSALSLPQRALFLRAANSYRCTCG